MRSPVQHSDKRVTPLTLDVTNAAQIQRAVAAANTLDVLINNAGIAIYDDLSNLDVLEQTFAVNFLSLLKVGLQPASAIRTVFQTSVVASRLRDRSTCVHTAPAARPVLADIKEEPTASRA
jgi:NAD(P)-dependent dehydrogenase (short-subunit alcohol dehydrogenase family)